MAILSGTKRVDGSDLPELDITDASSLKCFLSALAPDVIVNCAAFTAVDDCETLFEEANKVNAAGAANLAEYCLDANSFLVHISTDYVFDGCLSVGTGYTEEDEPHPATQYGVGKLCGEEAIRNIMARHLIVRTAWMYGRYGKNFLKTILRRVVSRPEEPLRVVNDQFGSPTWSYRLAQQVDWLIDCGVTGTYHSTGRGYCSWYEFAGEFLREMGVAHTVEPCSTDAMPRAASRPRNSHLENRRLEREGLSLMRDWREDLREFVSTHADDLLAEASAAAQEGGRGGVRE